MKRRKRGRTDFVPSSDDLSGLPLLGKVVDLGCELGNRLELGVTFL